MIGLPFRLRCLLPLYIPLGTDPLAHPCFSASVLQRLLPASFASRRYTLRVSLNREHSRIGGVPARCRRSAGPVFLLVHRDLRYYCPRLPFFTPTEIWRFRTHLWLSRLAQVSFPGLDILLCFPLNFVFVRSLVAVLFINIIVADAYSFISSLRGGL